MRLFSRLGPKEIQMTSRSKKKNKTPAKVSPPLDPLRAGMPALDSITGVKEMRKGKKVIRIIKTDEVDSYEEPARSKRRSKRSQ